MNNGGEIGCIQLSRAENLSECSPGSGERFFKILSLNCLRFARPAEARGRGQRPGASGQGLAFDIDV